MMSTRLPALATRTARVTTMRYPRMYPLIVAVRTKATAVTTSADPQLSSPPPPTPKNYGTSPVGSGATRTEPKPFDAIPRMPVLPFIGSGLEFGRLEPNKTSQKFHLVLRKVAAKYGPIVRLRTPASDKDTVFISDADAVADALRNEGPMPIRRGLPTWIYFREKNKVPLGIAFENGEEWKRMRSVIQTPIFPPKNAHAYCPTIGPATVQAMGIVENELRRAGPQTFAGEETFAIESIVMRWSIEAVSGIVLGQQLGALDDEPTQLTRDMISAVNAAFATTGPIFLMPEFVWRNQLAPAAREHFKALQTAMDVTNKLMTTTLTDCAKDPAKLHGTFLGHVLQRDATLTRDEMLSTAVDLLFAGIDTTSRSLLNIMNLLSRHPEAQTKLRNEIIAVAGADANATLDAKHLAKLKYMKNVIKEAMRLYSVVPIGGRILPHDAVVGGYLIPADTEVMFGMDVMSHDPKYFADPESFNPDRWDAKDIHPFASLPFGFGARMCVGRRIAEMEMTVFLAHLLRKFEIMPSPPPTDLVFNLVIANEKPMPLKFRPLGTTTTLATA
ncbi:hypothetical protein GGF31_002611 [Allomyces arbusculus]|nr:hypothetical protein GGF31_002611 [Allomyces arbusculus]